MKLITCTMILLTGISLISCSSSYDEDIELQQLSSFMIGSFSSQEQAEADSNYFDIRLEMVPIWIERNDAVWLYVEQAAAEYLDKPYRQRVYKVKRLEDSTFESAVYTMEEPARFVGAWKKEKPLAQLTPDSLTERNGCAIILKYKEDTYVGSTNAKDCESQLRGASYATSEVCIEEELLTSWDRGFDSTDTQVWGAELGPYIFKKIVKE